MPVTMLGIVGFKPLVILIFRVTYFRKVLEYTNLYVKFVCKIVCKICGFG